MKRFLVILEQIRTNCSAYSPDLPAYMATGSTKRQVTANMHGAIQMHLEGLKEYHMPIPRSRVSAAYIKIP
jgi:predicted RNase H-like HicB family nuclease